MSINKEQAERLEEILQVLGAERGSLNDRSKDFFDQTRERYEKFGAEILLSPKQWAWLENLYKEHARSPEEQSTGLIDTDMDDEIPF